LDDQKLKQVALAAVTITGANCASLPAHSAGSVDFKGYDICLLYI